MSKNCWERGELKMSVKEFGSFRRDMIAFHNDRSARMFSKAQHLYVNLKELGKGKRGFDYHTALENMLTNGSMRLSSYEIDGGDEITNALFPYEKINEHFTGRSKRPKAPKRSQFNPLKTNADRIPVGSEAGIGFDKKRRVVIWSVSENNHAVERAHDHGTGKEFFKRLSRVNWTLGTGGEIVGNDEYNQDTRESGGGANYVTNRYGVAEKQFHQSFAAVRSWR
jgi:hypothetical protein